jgi:CRISPR-associated endonuclease Cas2
MSPGKKEKLATVGYVILYIVGAAAIVSTAIIAPGVIVAFRKLGLDKKLINRRKYYVDESLKRLTKKGLITEVKKQGKNYFKLTREGKRALFRLETKSLAVKKPFRWDCKYRAIIFDIKETDRFIRNDVRYFLLQFGFVRLQDSVWVYPYPCEGAVNLMRANLDIEEGDEIVYMTVDSIENDGWLRKHFKLPIK